MCDFVGAERMGVTMSSEYHDDVQYERTEVVLRILVDDPNALLDLVISDVLRT